MSKVNSYFDSKEKAKHRLRRQETRSKKLSRKKKYSMKVYKWYRSGYVPRFRDRNKWYLSVDECMFSSHGYLKRYGCTKILKTCKYYTNRAVRRNTRYDDSYDLPVRNTYKRMYVDLDGMLW